MYQIAEIFRDDSLTRIVHVVLYSNLQALLCFASGLGAIDTNDTVHPSYIIQYTIYISMCLHS